MGFRSIQSNSDGFGIQKNPKRKTVNKRKKKRKTSVPKKQNASNPPVVEEISSTLPEGMASSMSPSTFDDKVQAELALAQLNGYIEQNGITGEESKKLLAEYLMKELQNQNRMG